MSWKASGLKAWMLQRASAVYMAVFFIYFLAILLICPPTSYADWHGWMRSTPMSLATAIFFLALLGHAWVGIRDVFLDYVKPFPLRVVLLSTLALSLLLMALWVLKVMLMGGA